MRVVWVAAAVLLAAGGSASAWSKAGHMATGAVAYRVLKKDSPDTIPKVVALLKRHPFYAEKHRVFDKRESWADILAELPEEQRDEALFMLAARWADDARPDETYYPPAARNDAKHYINRPFKPAGTPADVTGGEPDEINIVRAFPEFLKQATTADTDAKKAVALCWVLHLIGDGHQPLHTVSLYTAEFQLKDKGRLVGDRGGTWFYVRGKAGQRATGLHTIWDGLVTEAGEFRENRQAVAVLMADPDHAAETFADALKVTDFEKWIDESFALAPSAYVFEGKLLPGAPDASAAGVLPDGYTKAAEKVGKHRGVLAGYRMAQVMKKAFE